MGSREKGEGRREKGEKAVRKCGRGCLRVRGKKKIWLRADRSIDGTGNRIFKRANPGVSGIH
jgi:hypothetical protein